MKLTCLGLVGIATVGAIPSRFLPEHARGGLAAATMPHLLPPAPGAGSTKKLLTVPLDHFGDRRITMQVKYYVDDSHFDKSDPTAPIFVEMGGEGACGGASCDATCRAHKALAVSVEHRFYGESQPAGDRTDGNLRFLSVEQNLADTAAVVDAVQLQYSSSSSSSAATAAHKRPVMNFGGSYSGATAAWFRGAYPNTTMAAVSSSGVVNAILNFTAFDAQVATALDLPSPGCAARLQALTAAFARAHAAGGAAWDGAKTAMKCPNLIGTKLGDADFWYALADGAAMADQYGHKAQLCTALADAETPGATDAALIGAFSAFIAGFWGADFMAGCFYDSECFKKVSWADSGMARSWRWQKCSQVAFLQPGFHGSLRFEGLSLADLLEQCTYVFGDALPAAFPDVTVPFNAKFGGAAPKGTKIFYTDFSDDPWQRASVAASPEKDSPYCLETCNGCGHCGAGVPPSLHDCSDKVSAWVSKQLEADRVEEWLAASE
jgi:hypothetical protein